VLVQLVFVPLVRVLLPLVLVLVPRMAVSVKVTHDVVEGVREVIVIVVHKSHPAQPNQPHFIGHGLTFEPHMVLHWGPVLTVVVKTTVLVMGEHCGHKIQFNQEHLDDHGLVFEEHIGLQTRDNAEISVSVVVIVGVSVVVEVVHASQSKQPGQLHFMDHSFVLDMHMALHDDEHSGQVSQVAHSHLFVHGCVFALQ
jgi:hypothetical protein